MNTEGCDNVGFRKFFVVKEWNEIPQSLFSIMLWLFMLFLCLILLNFASSLCKEYKNNVSVQVYFIWNSKLLLALDKTAIPRYNTMNIDSRVYFLINSVFINGHRQFVLLIHNNDIILHAKGCEADHLMNCKLFIVDK